MQARADPFPTGAAAPGARFSVLHGTAWHGIALHGIALHCMSWHCTALYCTAWHSMAFCCGALHCTALPCPALHCSVQLHLTLCYSAWLCILSLLHIISKCSSGVSVSKAAGVPGSAWGVQLAMRGGQKAPPCLLQQAVCRGFRAGPKGARFALPLAYFWN